MIANDMMSYIKSDIIVFGYWCVYFYSFNVWFIFRNIKMGNNAIIRLCDISNYNDWIIRFNWLESNCDFIKLYCFDAHSKYGNEYSCDGKIFTIKKRISTS